MDEFIKQFGIDWRLLVSQAVNFFLVLVILRLYVYKPVSAILRERRRRVEEGIAKATEADQRLQDVQEMVRERVHAAEEQAVSLLREVEQKAKEREAQMMESVSFYDGLVPLVQTKSPSEVAGRYTVSGQARPSASTSTSTSSA